LPRLNIYPFGGDGAALRARSGSLVVSTTWFLPQTG
jgi:hypothetical protein